MRILGLVVVGLLVLGSGRADARPDKAATAAHATKKAPPAAKDAGSAADPAAPDPAADAAAAEPDPMASLPHITGPKLIDLGHNAEIDLPAGLVLYEQNAAQELVRKSGSDASAVIAAIVPTAGSWAVIIEAADVGYVSDSDAEDLDANALLQQFREGTTAQNRQRVAQGVPELILDGWSEPPRYDRGPHHLVWGLNAHDTNGKVVNFFTRFLGRNGFLSVNLIDAPEAIEASKKEAMAILGAVRFRAGQRYEDHADGDKDSGMGLTALVLGGTAVIAAKKTGLLIALLIFLKKGLIVIGAAIAGFFRWITGRGKRKAKASAATATDVGSDAGPGAPPIE
jgi:uncharacterized membrane-anchored protein